MPGWHESTTELREGGELLTAGVALEQHPDRTRLFMQWKQMAWPVLWDPFNILDFKVVPVSYVVDPNGVVLVVHPSLDKAEELERRIRSTSAPVVASRTIEDSTGVFGPELVDRSDKDLDPAVRSRRAAALGLWGDDLNESVEEARLVVESWSDPTALFRLGVTLLMRHDSSQRQPGDFAGAVEAWNRALVADPDQYIWRRRLQQYGPRLSKPYPFYDWVPDARSDIRDRGDEPVELTTEPQGSEFADPADESADLPETASDQRPDARVTEDPGRLIAVDPVVIPPVAPPGHTVRIHLFLKPNQELDAHWNNEAGFSEAWVDPPEGWLASPEHQHLPPGSGDVSSETRHIESEVTIPEDAGSSTVEIPIDLFYYGCEGRSGVCVYRRQQARVEITVDEAMISLPG